MSNETRIYRPVPRGQAMCPTCEATFALIDATWEPTFLNEYDVRQFRRVLPKHGPRTARCAGSHGDPLPWLEATRLPTWDEMSDLDRGAALLFLWKAWWENDYAYARRHYPACYFDHPMLVGLDAMTACTHASQVAGSWHRPKHGLDQAEMDRLYNLAFDRERTVIAVADGGVS